MIRKQNPIEKWNQNKSNLVKQNLHYMDAYGGATTEQQIETLKRICYRILLFLHATQPN